jgi:hypothetical protein
MVSVFCGLKFTSHFVDHACNFTRSSLSVCAVSYGSSTIKYRLVERKQRVVINNSTSSWRDINAGVPQGSILGPLLFIVFINDILTDINSTMKLFADDTSLYLIVDDP